MRRILFGLAALLLLLGACGADDDEATSDDSASRHAAAFDTESSASAGGGDDGAPSAPVQEVGLEAGSVDDNELWEDYLRYREAFALLGIPVDDLPVEGRRIITVTDEAGVPILDAEVTIEGPGTETRSRTGSDGRVVFLAPVGELDEQQSAPTFTATVRHGEAKTTAELSNEPRQTIVVDGAANDDAIRLDVLFLLDATGSMGDEIQRLKANMVGVAERIAESPSAPDVRFALTHYRDSEDEYLTRTIDFTGDVGAFVETLRGVVADGGGDTPEAMNEAFAEAVGAPSWRTGEDTVRLVFLVADAPPHLGRGTSYVDTIGAAAMKGIRVFPIASSGTEDQAEFIFRQIAQATLGRFVFLSYGADGAALGGETNIEEEDYDVLPLDELVVRLVEEQLAPLVSR